MGILKSKDMRILDMQAKRVQGVFIFEYKGYEVSVSTYNPKLTDLAIYKDNVWLENSPGMTIPEAILYIDGISKAAEDIKAKAMRLYELEVIKDKLEHIKIEALSRSQAAKIARSRGYEVCSVNLIG